MYLIICNSHANEMFIYLYLISEDVHWHLEFIDRIRVHFSSQNMSECMQYSNVNKMLNKAHYADDSLCPRCFISDLNT